MKRVGYWVVLSSLFFVACKKDYSCVCKRTYIANSITTALQDDVYIYKEQEDKAEKLCKENNGNGSDVLGTYTRACEIK